MAEFHSGTQQAIIVVIDTLYFIYARRIVCEVKDYSIRSYIRDIQTNMRQQRSGVCTVFEAKLDTCTLAHRPEAGSQRRILQVMCS